MKPESMKRVMLVLIMIAALAAFLVFARSTSGQKANSENEPVVSEQWEYLVVTGATTNFTPSDNPRMRKDSSGAFAREAFVLEQNMDKLGAKGWQLVSVSGSQGDPVYYFKRRK